MNKKIIFLTLFTALGSMPTVHSLWTADFLTDSGNFMKKASIGIATSSVFAAASLYKFGLKKTAYAATAFTVGYGVAALKNWWYLDTVTKKINAATITGKDEQFSLAFWQYNRWPTALDVGQFSEDVYKNLTDQIKANNIGYNYTFTKLANTSKSDINLSTLQKTIKDEVDKLKALLLKVGSYSDAPREVYAVLKPNGTRDTSCNFTTEVYLEGAVVMCANKDSGNGSSVGSFELCGYSLDGERLNKIRAGLTSYKNDNRQILPRLLCIPSFYNPTTWVFGAPGDLSVAVDLYIDLFAVYVRLLAIKAIVDKKANEKLSDHSSEQTLKNISSQIQSLLTSYQSVGNNNSAKITWITTCTTGVSGPLADLKKGQHGMNQYSNDILAIEGLIKAVLLDVIKETHNTQNSTVPVNLSAAKQQVDQLIIKIS